MAWRDEDAKTCMQMWDDGKSATEISRALGGRYSRNACIGKIARMGGETRAQKLLGGGGHRPLNPEARVQPAPPRHVAPATAIPKAEKDASRRRFAPPTPTPGPAAAVASAVVITLPGQSQCKWPIGDPAVGGFHFCPEKAVIKGEKLMPYCEDHCRKAYQPPKETAKRRLAATH